jgi:NAD(P)-dependent dehydrogenase (short-subunit alcohol dehydrogenase family)
MEEEAATMAWTPSDIGDQQGRVVVVTGANGGLGAVIARELARRGAHVIMAARDQQKAASTHRAIEAAIPDARLQISMLDLASLDAVRACAAEIIAAHPRIDLLINNAGIMAIPEQTTAEGFEKQLGVNHLGHFVLTRRLLPALLQAPDARVVSVTSFARFVGRSVKPDNPHLRGSYEPWAAYGQAKLANLLFAVELQRRLAAAGARVKSLAAHPGLSHTDLQTRSVRETGGGLSQRLWQLAARTVGTPAERGAQSVLRAATDANVRGGELYGPKWGFFGSPVRRPLLDRRLVGRAPSSLWQVSERETGEQFDIADIQHRRT